MTHDETRDELARMDGWNYEPAQVDGMGAVAHYWWRWTINSAHGGRTYANTHPTPPTLDAANAAVPEGWEWKRYTDMDDGEVYAAWRSVGEGVWADEVNVPDHGRGHEMDDLYALALACRRAMEKQK